MLSSNSSKPTSGKIKREQDTSVILEGISVSAGIVFGKALVDIQEQLNICKHTLAEEEVEKEVQRFRDALESSYAQLEDLKDRVAGILGAKDASIFDAHMMLVNDQVIHDEVVQGIREKRTNAEYIYQKVVDRYTTALKGVNDNYIRDRLTDIRDVSVRVIRNLQGEEICSITNLKAPHILIGHDLTPSDTAGMDRKNVIGFATAIGSRTSHTAIVARSLGIPAVVGVNNLTEKIANNDTVIVDGYRGRVIVRPDEKTLKEYKKHLAEQERWFKNIEEEAALPAETKDGFRFQLAANIELPQEVQSVKQNHGVGIGLFRTEYLFMNQEELPDENEQFEAYKQVASQILPNSVILRTVDVGGDKFLTQYDMHREMNPFLGVRAIRFSLSKPRLFICQLKAILRASAYGKVRVMFPMISTIEELQQALDYLEQAKQELKREKRSFNPHLDVGIMIEVPSAALIADHLAEMVDFFSIGTNDLIQYTLAADRGNSDVAYLYQPCHPSIIRMIRNVVKAAYNHGKWVSICGEMAAEPIMLPLVLGLGIHELSMSPVALGVIKRLIRRMRLHETEELVAMALKCGSSHEVRKLCEEYVRKIAPELIPR